MQNKYLFQSERLGFREWHETDLPEFARLNADEAVMKHFPSPLSEAESAEFIERLQAHHAKHGYCYFAVEVLDNAEFIGFIGLAYQTYESEFTPATDIGWRLKESAWGKGYATEGAKRCLELAFTELNIKHLIATCPASNTNSEKVMKKIGMSKKGNFLHPRLKDFPHLEECYCYEIQAE